MVSSTPSLLICTKRNYARLENWQHGNSREVLTCMPGNSSSDDENVGTI